MAVNLNEALLPVLQEISEIGGNFTSILISKGVLAEIERRADDGDETMETYRSEIRHSIDRIASPQDFAGFNAFFEIYHEALFYLIAANRSLSIARIKESSHKTPDFCTVGEIKEAFEVKTIDFSGGQWAYGDITKQGLKRQEEARSRASKKGFGSAVGVVSPHGDARNLLEAVRRVIRQIDGNVKKGQFAEAQTILVVNMARTAITLEADGLKPLYFDADIGEELSGPMWAIAARLAGDCFYYTDRDSVGVVTEILDVAGILRDNTFVRGLIFVDTIWHKLDPPNDEFPSDAFKLFGIWNGNYEPPVGVTPITLPESAFTQLCDALQVL